MRAIVASALSGLFVATAASAQAWVLPKGSGTFDFTYARATADTHILSELFPSPTGELTREFDLGKEYSNIAVLSGDFGITSQLAVRGDVSYVSSKYNGVNGEGALDDGNYHGTMTDVRVEFRYLAVDTHNFSVTPFAGLVAPTHHYEAEGHAAPGRKLWQLPIGFGLGYIWPHDVHTTYVQGRYAYAFMSDGDGYDFSRSNWFVEGGTYLARWCSIRAVVGNEHTHGGIQWVDIDTEEEFETHDQRTSSRYWSAAGGLTFKVNPMVALSASYSQLLSGANIVDTRTIWVAMTWYFGGAGEKLIGRAR